MIFAQFEPRLGRFGLALDVAASFVPYLAHLNLFHFCSSLAQFADLMEVCVRTDSILFFVSFLFLFFLHLRRLLFII